MEESERLLDDVELFLSHTSNGEGYIQEEEEEEEEEERRYRDALRLVKNGKYEMSCGILSEIVKRKRENDSLSRRSLWNLNLWYSLRAVCYERRGLTAFAEIDKEKSRIIRNKWRQKDPTRENTVNHVKRFAFADNSVAFQVLIKTTASLVLLYGFLLVVNINTTMSIITTILLGLIRMRCFILFHDCTHGSFFASQRLNILIGTIVGFYVYVFMKIMSHIFNFTTLILQVHTIRELEIRSSYAS